MATRKSQSCITTLEDIGRLILHSHDLDGTLRNITALVARRMGTEVCSIYLLEPDGRTLTMRASHGLPRRAVGRVAVAVGEGLTGAVAAQRRVVAVREPQDHPLFRYFKETQEERFHTYVGIPLLDHGEIAGVLVVQTREPRDFTEEELIALGTIAGQVSFIVANARLLDSVRRSEEEARRYAEELARIRGAQGEEPAAGAARATERLVRGTAVSPGITSGLAHLMDEHQPLPEVPADPSADPSGELARLEQALEQTRIQTLMLERQVAGRLAEQDAAIFHTHLMVLEDRGFLDALRREVARGHGASNAVRLAVAGYEEAFSRIEDPYLRERAADIRDIGRRVIAHLAGRGHPSPALSAEGILVAGELFASDMAALDPARVRGIVAERGGATSHAALMAKSLGIPAIFGARNALRTVSSGDRLILDANSGCVYVNPGEVVQAEYLRLEEETRREGALLDGLRDTAPASADGTRVTLRANIGLVSDVAVALRCGAEGVGLYRTEFPYMVRDEFPTRDEQYRLYRRVAEGFGGAPVTIRTLDVGGDKYLPYATPPRESNPFLGWRSLRFTLAHRDIFRTQLEAILMAGVHGPVRVLFPLVTGVGDLRACRLVLEEARENLRGAGIAHAAQLPLGVMIEVPAAVYQADALAREADFFAVGSNDLVQYLLAADRTNHLVRSWFDPLHPAVLAALLATADAARRHGRGLSLCGDMATEPAQFLALLGLGYREFSVPAPWVPRLKLLLHGVRLDEAAAAARAGIDGDRSPLESLSAEALARTRTGDLRAAR